MLDYLEVNGIPVIDYREGGAAPASELIEVDGLTGVPGVRGDTLERSTEHGVLEPAFSYAGARVVTLDYEAWDPSEVDPAWNVWEDFVRSLNPGLVDPGVLVRWRRAGGTVDVEGYGRLAGDTLAVLKGAAPVVPAQVQLRFADPVWKASEVKAVSTGAPAAGGGVVFPVVFPVVFGGFTGGSVTASNDGNAPTWPKIVISGPINSPVVRNVETGRGIYFDGLFLAEGQTLVVETTPANRSATVQGANVAGSIRYRDSYFFPLEPGGQTLQFYGLGGGYTVATTLTASWQDGYWT